MNEIIDINISYLYFNHIDIHILVILKRRFILIITYDEELFKIYLHSI